MKKNLIILLSCFLFNCSHTIEGEKIIYKKGLYYLDKKPVSGEVVFKNKENNLDFKINLLNGIPKGNWFSYGLKNEVIQFGNFTNIPLNNISPKIRRIQKYEFHEGIFKNVLYYIVTEDSLTKDEKQLLIKKLNAKMHSDSLVLKYVDKEF